ncbi:hypothetical protein DFS28_101250 [Pseudomonas sp. 478]|uniref:hypothetical protein n=1 Tax=unclassified Pseudomonas TaxID=196821 RepID=UPI000DAD99CA|nr:MULTISPECIES: hypothetical protein [unclassified Pseudomonas]PZX01903.1 hypothetical protein DFS28_101250 [Pseudomonas sp. 478]TCV52165.1 hypothetical protein EDB99_106204 [Pseudomonas sp. 460]
MIKAMALYLLSSFFVVHAGERLEVESNGCTMNVGGSDRFSFFKTDENVSFVKYKYKDGRVENVKISCKEMTLADAISSDYVQEKDGLKVGIGSHPLSKAQTYSGRNWTGVEGVYFLDSVCFTTSFEAGNNHIFFIDACGEEQDVKELRASFLSLLKRSKTYYIDNSPK